jgi:hypothetical protein
VKENGRGIMRRTPAYRRVAEGVEGGGEGASSAAATGGRVEGVPK